MRFAVQDFSNLIATFLSGWESAKIINGGEGIIPIVDIPDIDLNRTVNLNAFVWIFGI